MGGLGSFLEPLIVVCLLLVGTWINRDFNPWQRRQCESDTLSFNGPEKGGVAQPRDIEKLETTKQRSISPSMLVVHEPRWRTRSFRAWGFEKKVTTPNTRRFKDYFLSRLLQKYPFLVECWYWALIYWVSSATIKSFLIVLTSAGVSTWTGLCSSFRH